MKFGLTRRQILNTGMAVGLGTLLAKLGYAANVASHPTPELGKPPRSQKKNFPTIRDFVRALEGHQVLTSFWEN